MGYIHLEQGDGCELIFVDKPLDFLGPGEHEIYLNKYHIDDNFQSQSRFDMSIQPIKSQDEVLALLNHMINPEQYPDPYEREQVRSTDTKQTPIFLSCTVCDGHYVLRNGKNGLFFGCSNYPRCKSTKTVADVTYSWLAQRGINIYEVERPCWKCEKPIKLRSYFPQIDLLLDQPELAGKLDLSIIRLSTVDTLDQYLSSKHKEIYMKFSKKANGKYMANNCPYCQSLQGSTLTLESMYKCLIDALKDHTLLTYIAETLTVTETSLPKTEWKSIITEVLKHQE